MLVSDGSARFLGAVSTRDIVLHESTMNSLLGRATCLLLAVGCLTCGSSSTSDRVVTNSDGAQNDGDGGNATVATDASDAGSCVPCKGSIIDVLGRQLYECTQVKNPSPAAILGAKIDLVVTALPDGTCMLDCITLQCGGNGTFADGSPITWTLLNGVLSFQDSTRGYSCAPQ